MSKRINPAEYPMNLLKEVNGGTEWNHEFPEDFDESLEYVLDTLTQREKDVILMRFKEGYTFNKIAKIYDITNSRIHQIFWRIIYKLMHQSRKKYLINGLKVQRKLNKEIAEKNAIPKFSIESSIPNNIEVHLIRGGITSLDKLLSLTYEQLLEIPRIGKKSATQIVEILHRNGYSLKDTNRNPSLFYEYCERLTK